MSDDLVVEVVDLEKELNLEENITHAYIVCSWCMPKIVKGVIIETACGILLRFRGNHSSVNCSSCEEIRSVTPDPDMLPCTICGHRNP